MTGIERAIRPEIFIVILLLLGNGCKNVEEPSIRDLYDRAAVSPKGETEALATLQALADGGDEESLRLVTQVAFGRAPLVLPAVQMEAIRLVGERGDHDNADLLVQLLSPHQGIGVRLAVVDALNEMECGPDCVRAVLFYLYRLHAGEPNFEDVDEYGTLLPMLRDRLLRQAHADRDRLLRSLDGLLADNYTGLSDELVSLFGLGTEFPSPFALELVSRLNLAEACPLLLNSQARLANLSRDDPGAPYDSLSSLVDRLECHKVPEVP